MNKDYLFIRGFGRIKIIDACKKYKLNKSNLYNNKLKEEDYKKVREYLETEYAKLYLIEANEDETKSKIQS